MLWHNLSISRKRSVICSIIHYFHYCFSCPFRQTVARAVATTAIIATIAMTTAVIIAIPAAIARHAVSTKTVFWRVICAEFARQTPAETADKNKKGLAWAQRRKSLFFCRKTLHPFLYNWIYVVQTPFKNKQSNRPRRTERDTYNMPFCNSCDNVSDAITSPNKYTDTTQAAQYARHTNVDKNAFFIYRTPIRETIGTSPKNTTYGIAFKKPVNTIPKIPVATYISIDTPNPPAAKPVNTMTDNIALNASVAVFT